jgi:hypothetical protein
MAMNWEILAATGVQVKSRLGSKNRSTTILAM